jgi:hypothetical protein
MLTINHRMDICSDEFNESNISWSASIIFFIELRQKISQCLFEIIKNLLAFREMFYSV